MKIISSSKYPNVNSCHTYSRTKMIKVSRPRYVSTDCPGIAHPPRLAILPAVPSYVLVGIRKKITYGCRLRDKVGDHAGSLIASMAIDLATKSSPEFNGRQRGKSRPTAVKASLASPGLVSIRTLQHPRYPMLWLLMYSVYTQYVNRQGSRQEERTTQSELVFAFVVESARSSISARVKSEEANHNDYGNSTGISGNRRYKAKLRKTGLPRNTPTPFSDHLFPKNIADCAISQAKANTIDHASVARRIVTAISANVKKSFRQHDQNPIGSPMHNPA
ncbi:hypothetical protein DBV15_07246, partial [Temnothorax longispinosus]